MELTYIKVGDYYIPNLTAEPMPSRDLGKYGRMRLCYLQEGYGNDNPDAMLICSKVTRKRLIDSAPAIP